MKIRFIRLAILAIAFFMITGVKAQEWSAAQKEIWKAETDCWSTMAKGDLSGFFDFFHQDYIGWDNGSELPSTKEDMKKAFTFFYSGIKVPFHQIKPLSIKIYGDIAFVHYTYMMVIEQQDGKKKTEKGRWTDILMKQGGKWLIIGDHGGETEDKK